MIRPDVILTWPTNCDYPLWRAFIQDNREYFKKVIIVFHNTNSSPNYTDFVREQMAYDRITFLESRENIGPKEDWRNVAINIALNYSISDWIWFTEQDFFLKAPMTDILTFVEHGNDPVISNVVAAFQEKRMHPCSVFIRRETLMKTRLDFSVVPNISDHFSLLQEDLKHEQILVIPPHMYHHMNGLSHNMYLLHQGQKPVYREEEFREYIDNVMWSNMQIQPVMVEAIEKYRQSASDTV